MHVQLNPENRWAPMGRVDLALGRYFRTQIVERHLRLVLHKHAGRRLFGYVGHRRDKVMKVISQ
jgi:uncharacterized protein with von Willebrand factor type A (vWA) domain